MRVRIQAGSGASGCRLQAGPARHMLSVNMRARWQDDIATSTTNIDAGGQAGAALLRIVTAVGARKIKMATTASGPRRPCRRQRACLGFGSASAASPHGAGRYRWRRSSRGAPILASGREAHRWRIRALVGGRVVEAVAGPISDRMLAGATSMWRRHSRHESVSVDAREHRPDRKTGRPLAAHSQVLQCPCRSWAQPPFVEQPHGARRCRPCVPRKNASLLPPAIGCAAAIAALSAARSSGVSPFPLRRGAHKNRCTRRYRLLAALQTSGD